VVFILPFIAIVTLYSFNFALDAYRMGEGSGDPGGLPYRWLIKGMIPLSFVLIGLVSLGLITRALLTLMNIRLEPPPSSSHLV
jgi:TRAP-type mannitol/chloroaromatic compound transport system permease small subunit